MAQPGVESGACARRAQTLKTMEHAFQAELKTILVVDDRDDCRITTKWFLTNFGYAVDSARSAEEALSVFDAKIHDLIITDNSMPGMSGVEMAHIIKLRSPVTPIIMYSGTLPENRTCLDVVIKKPAHLLELKDAADKILGTRLDSRHAPAS
jgi:CheY-like chemotaxis protein